MSTPVHRWSLVVPVKVLARAKSRLATAAGPYRERLALAFATDTVAAALRCPRVREVVVVTDDPVAATRLAALGAAVVADVPDAGLNPALVHGADHAAGGAREGTPAPPDGSVPATGVGALSADLPALRPDELARALDAAAHKSRAFVSDVAGTGTTLYTTQRGIAFTPAFGPRSGARHRAQGAYELPPDDIASLRRDVDTLDDLRAALALGVGPRTSAIAGALGVLADPSGGWVRG